MVSLLFVAGLFLAACGNSATTTMESKSTKQEIAVSTPGELSTLDSAQYTDVNSSDMIGQISE